MLVNHKNTLTFNLGSSQDPNNQLNLTNEIAGGSDDKYIQAGSDKVNGSDFQIDDVETKTFKLGHSNTFDLDILTLVETPVADITGILVYAYDLSDEKKANPVRFKVDLRLNTMGSSVYMGNLSNFSMMNLLETKIEKLRVYNAQVDTDTFANLVIVVISKNKSE